jgi:iron complex transport system permease protein
MKIKFSILILLLFVSVIASLKCGSVDIRWGEIYSAIIQKSHTQQSAIIWQIRIPRTVLALIVGAGLALSGAILQSVLINPLAEPYTLGISGGASFGVAICILFFPTSHYFLPLGGWMGGIFSILLVSLLAYRKGFTTTSLILAGIIINFLFSSLVLFLFAIFKPDEIQKILLWLMGDLSSTSIVLLKVSLIIIIPAACLSLIFFRNLDILILGDEKAHSLGLNVKKQRILFYFLASTIAGTCISLSGMIGFVGLLVPHLVRKFFGYSNKWVLPASLVTGGVFLTLADTLSRILISPLELPVGVLTALMGSIFLLLVLIIGKEWKIG